MDETGQTRTVTRQYSYKDNRSDQCDNASTDRRAPDGSSGSADLSATPSTWLHPVGYAIDLLYRSQWRS